MRKKTFSLIELLVVISIIAILASMLLPSLARAKKAAIFTTCKNNLHNIGLGAGNYESDHRTYPIAGRWDWDRNPQRLKDDVAKTADGTPLPWTATIDQYSSSKIRHNSFQNMNSDINDENNLQLFLCPAEDEYSAGALLYLDNFNGTTKIFGKTAYAANSGALGGAEGGLIRGMGNPNLNSMPSVTAMYFSGQKSNSWNCTWGQNQSTSTTSLYNLYTGNNAGPSDIFDNERHDNKMNILTMDGSTKGSYINQSLNNYYLWIQE